MIDINREEVFPVKEVPKKLPARDGKRHHMNTVFRWTNKGLRGVTLETVRIGGRLYTSARALQEFTERLSRPLSAPSQSSIRDKQLQEVMRRLRMEGFCGSAKESAWGKVQMHGGGLR